MYATKQKALTQRIAPKSELISGNYWIVRKAPNLSGDAMVWWVRPDSAGSGAHSLEKMAGNTIQERNTLISNLSNSDIAEAFFK